MDIKQEILDIGAYRCKLFATASPEVVLVQPSARHEEKADGIGREVELIAGMAAKGFALLTFDTKDWARALMPWHDDAVSRDEEVGRHAHDTLYDIERSLQPWLQARYGCLPCVIGGYSLGGLFALWAASESDTFAAVAAASPSLWIREWGGVCREPSNKCPVCVPQSWRPRGALPQRAHEEDWRLRAPRASASDKSAQRRPYHA